MPDNSDGKREEGVGLALSGGGFRATLFHLGTKRALSIIAEQTRALRKRCLIKDYIKGEMGGAYWGIATRIRGYELEENGRPGPLVEDSDVTGSLSKVRTRLSKFNAKEQEQLINWGYALADAAMRRYVLEPGVEPGRLPYPERPL